MSESITKQAQYQRTHRAKRRRIAEYRARAELAAELMMTHKLLNVQVGDIVLNASGLTHPIENTEIDDEQPEDRFFKDLADPEIKYEDLNNVR